MNELKPIPIPLKQRWHEFRVVYLPILTFVGLLAAIAHMWSLYVQPAAIVGEVESRNPVTNDVVKQMLPWMDVAREELFAGRAVQYRTGQSVFAADNKPLCRISSGAMEGDQKILAEILSAGAEQNLLLLSCYGH